ncbi:MAG: N-acetyl-gamma-glutamyl-phosphate reductase [Planctomycetota bacterium]
MLKVAIAGASGYVGGELLRLFSMHPAAEVVSISSERHAGHWAHRVHPHLRGRSELRFVPLERLEPADVLVLALPHGRAAALVPELAGRYERIIDCSADFRLGVEDHRRARGEPHPAPEWAARFVYGLPELHRDRIREARWVSGVGCNATACNLALLPLVRAGLLDPDRDVVADVKAGSSEAGREPSRSGQHAERAGVVRSYAPTGHRHAAEVEAATGLSRFHLSVTAVDTVRGALATVHAFPREELDERSLWSLYRDACAGEPFLRIVHEKGGDYRHPDPKTVVGTNVAELGWSLDPATGRVVALAAIDNLTKGAAGSAVQCLNLMCGFDETLGLDWPGLWPA